MDYLGLSILEFLKFPPFHRMCFAYCICLVIGYLNLRRIKKAYISKEDEIQVDWLFTGFILPFIYCLIGLASLSCSFIICAIPLLICLFIRYSTGFIWKWCIPIIAIVIMYGSSYIDPKLYEYIDNSYEAETKVISYLPSAFFELIEDKFNIEYYE